MPVGPVGRHGRLTLWAPQDPGAFPGRPTRTSPHHTRRFQDDSSHLPRTPPELRFVTPGARFGLTTLPRTAPRHLQDPVCLSRFYPRDFRECPQDRPGDLLPRPTIPGHSLDLPPPPPPMSHPFPAPRGRLWDSISPGLPPGPLDVGKVWDRIRIVSDSRSVHCLCQLKLANS